MKGRSTRLNGKAARFETEARNGVRVIQIKGDWVVGEIGPAEVSLRGISRRAPQPTRIELAGVGRLDTAGAWLIHHSAKLLSIDGRPAQIAGANASQQRLLDVVAANEPEALPPPQRSSAFLDAVARLGATVENWVRTAIEMIAFSGLALAVAGGSLRGKRRWRVTSTIHHIEQAGLNAVPIISLINFLIGAVISFMSADVLRDYGGEIFSVDLITFAFLREFGVLLSAVMVAGRSGSAFTAEIGAMKGHEEIDAMRALALDPVEILVLPRTIALIVSLPLLTFIADMMGLMGGGLVSWSVLGLGPTAFMNRMLVVSGGIDNFWVGMIKAPFFAFLIAIIGCYQGFKVTGTAESVGERTTISVVQSIFTVIVIDALFALFFLEIGY